MNIDGKTRTCGLIGNPVEHTLSPVIHNTLSKLTNQNLVYVPFLVLQGQVEDAVKGAYGLNILGMNVTVPYKEQVIPYLKEMDELAKKIGAVNTLVRTEGGYKGYNTDMTGLLRGMQSENIEVQGETVVILGAGGAARAVTYLCASEGAASIYIANRTISKAQSIATEVNDSFQKECVIPITMDSLAYIKEDRILAIQCTSVGLSPNDDEVVTSDESFYSKIHTGVDIIYKPAETKFMKLVKQNGGKTMNGLKMLLYQGIIAYELWNNVTVSDEQAEIVLKEMIAKLD